MKKILSLKQYQAIVERDEDGYYVAWVPALPGCHTQAKTMEQLRKRLKEVIELCLEVARDDRGYQKQIEAFAHHPTFVGLETVTV